MNAAVAITTTAAQIQAILVVTSRLLFLALRRLQQRAPVGEP